MVPPHGHCHGCREYKRPTAWDSICDACRTRVTRVTFVDVLLRRLKVWLRPLTRYPTGTEAEFVAWLHQGDNAVRYNEAFDRFHQDLKDFATLRQYMGVIYQERYFAVQRICEYYEGSSSC